MQTMSAKDIRNNFADVIDKVAVAGDTFVVTKFGKPRAMIVPISQSKARRAALEETFGAWKDRKDIKDTAKWVRDLRTRMSLRQR